MSQTVVKRDKPVNRVSVLKSFTHPYFLDALIAVLTFSLIFLLIFTALSPERYELRAGDIPSEPIAAPRDVEDERATREKVEQAKDRVNEIYTLDQAITATVASEMDEVYSGMDAARNAASDKVREWEQQQEDILKAWQESQKQQQEQQTPDPAQGEQQAGAGTDLQTEQPAPTQQPPVIPTEPDYNQLYNDAFLEEAQKLFPIQLSKDDIMTIVMAEQRDLNQLKLKLTGTMKDMLEVGIKQEQLSEFKVNLRDAVQGMAIPNELKLLGINLGVPHLKANLLYDPEKTLNEKQKAASEVEKVIYKKGQFIVQAGQPVTEDQIEMLAELGLLKDNKIDIPLIVGIALYVLICIGLAVIYLFYFEKELFLKPHILIMISAVLCMVLGLTYVTALLNPYLIPAAMAGMLLAVLINTRIGIVVNIITALLTGMMSGMQLFPAVVAITGGMAGICLLRYIQQRNSLVWAGIGVAAGNLLAAGSFEMFTAGGWPGPLYNSLWGALGGLLAAVLTIGTLPIWENLFGIVTPIKLVELGNPNQPILKRLLMETPGTYHHSIIVANLAESAADAIGANGLLARVGSYYHDIGKLERPYFFKENQLYEDNPHDRLDPELSTRIITSHAKDGIVLAKRYKVPPIIYDFILQHHGTTPVVYFYHKAKNNTDKDIKLDQFRYPGPKPNSRETAIVMMADTAEAAVRAMTDHTPDKVEELIRRLIREKLDDGQFDDCSLTIRDLNTIVSTFASVISGIFHERVKYPIIDLKEERTNL
jgi:putative nucleotidyltransferase with HDIG domain